MIKSNKKVQAAPAKSSKSNKVDPKRINKTGSKSNKKLVDEVIKKKPDAVHILPPPKFSPKTLKDIKEAAYNPRSITKKQLLALKESYNEFGDLSGVVINVHTKTIISGHQRLKTHAGRKHRIDKHKVVDKFGTVAAGYIHFEAEGNTRADSVPYREVSWTLEQEKAANIAANAAGGEFDRVKLGKVLRDLEKKSFDIEKIPLEAFEFAKAHSSLNTAVRQGTEVDENGTFQKVDLNELSSKMKKRCANCGHPID